MNRGLRRAAVGGIAGLVSVLGVVSGATSAAAAQAAPTVVETTSVSGVVWFDRNRDQVRQGDEPGADAIRVMVTNTATGEIFGSTTDGAGSYLVDGLPAGEYRVTADNVGYLPTTPEDVFVRIGAGSPATVNFGIDGGSISGVAWLDTNPDGVRQSFEPRINGITITVSGVRAASTVTGQDGAYVVEDLPAGNHVLQFARPNQQFGFTAPFVGDPTTDSDVADTEQGLAFVPLAISTGGVADAVHVDAGYVVQG